ncbi:anti-anti-sigma factor, partial [Salmonella enterica subsp. enterica serovar Typhi]|nr:anti-anti-sigma factor [Salmonella enterica subsp. enterica serovar Typhi]
MNTIAYIKEELKTFINENEITFNQKLLTEAINVSTK